MRHNKKIQPLGSYQSSPRRYVVQYGYFFDSSQKNLYHVGQSQSVESVRWASDQSRKRRYYRFSSCSFRYLQSKEAVTELFKEISVKIADRPGGYTRILKTGNRLGDNAKTCFIELVDYNENMLKEKVAKKATRTRRSKKSAAPAAVTAEAPANEAPVSEAPATPTEEKAAE